MTRLFNNSRLEVLSKGAGDRQLCVPLATMQLDLQVNMDFYMVTDLDFMACFWNVQRPTSNIHKMFKIPNYILPLTIKPKMEVLSQL